MNFKIGVCQMSVVDNKEANLKKAEKMIREAAAHGSRLVVLPEMFNCPYKRNAFPMYAESYPGKTTSMLANLAKELQIDLVGGSIPEQDQGCLYNTSYMYGKTGDLLGKYRKMHLFDVNIEGGIRFKESDSLGYGEKVTVV